MKLGIDATPLEELPSGIGRYTQQIIKHIRVTVDWDITLFCRRPLQVDAAGCSQIIVPPKFGVRSLGFYLNTATLADEHQLDGFFSPRHQLPRGMLVPSVITIHDLAWKTVPDTMQCTNYLLDYWLMPDAIHRSNSIIAVSEHTAALLRKTFPVSGRKTCVVHEAPFTSESEVGDPQVDGNFILSVGTREPRKNYERLIAAFKPVARKHPGLRLVIVGGAGWKTDIPKLVDQLQVNDSVILLESATDNDLHRLYAACQFLAMPSHYEGFGLPVVEAMAHGKCVLVAKGSACEEIAGAACLAVDSNCTSQLTKAMDNLLSDTETRHRLQNAATVRATMFSWQLAANETIEIIKRAVNDP